MITESARDLLTPSLINQGEKKRMIGPKVKKTLNGIFLFGKLAILTNIGE
jgi:hypothetical protein